jgi:hypothetical protein
VRAFFINYMNQPPKSLSAPKSPSSKRASNSKRRTLADFGDLVFLERAARRACFVPIPRAVARLMESNNDGSDANGIELNVGRGRIGASLPWSKNGADIAPLSESRLGDHAAEARSIMLVVDQRLAMHFGSRSKTKSVVAAEIAAFIAWRALAQDTRIGALVFNDRKIDWLWPNCNRLSVMLILHAVLNQNHALVHNGNGGFNTDMLNRALRRIDRDAKDDFTVFLITDASGYNDETRALLASISQRCHLQLLLIVDPRQKKFSKTRWLLSKGFLSKSRGRGGRDEAWLSLNPGARSGIRSEGGWPGKIPIIRFSTWDSAVEQLRRAARKSILPPQDRPAQPVRHHRNGNGNGKHNGFTNTIPKDLAIPLNTSTTTQRSRPQL